MTEKELLEKYRDNNLQRTWGKGGVGYSLWVNGKEQYCRGYTFDEMDIMFTKLLSVAKQIENLTS